uniref:Uncharacterized protein n=1 Tax=Trichuris muris TaxID=70415 RepID=A0A5S6QXZ8_TRIMR
MEKLRKKRAAERRKREEAMKINFPYPPTMDSVNRFFVDNVSLSDELLSCGDIDGSAYYLAAALVGSGQTQECVEALRSTIPPELYNALLQKFPEMKLQFEMEIAKVKARYDRNRHTEHVLFDEAYD